MMHYGETEFTDENKRMTAATASLYYKIVRT